MAVLDMRINHLVYIKSLKERLFVYLDGLGICILMHAEPPLYRNCHNQLKDINEEQKCHCPMHCTSTECSKANISNLDATAEVKTFSFMTFIQSNFWPNLFYYGSRIPIGKWTCLNTVNLFKIRPHGDAQ